MRRAELIATAGPRILRSAWLRVLLGGSAVYAVLTAAAIDTQDINLVPAVLVLGAALIPVVFLAYVFERLAVAPALLLPLVVCFAAGGSLGVAAAAVLEYQTLRDLGALPMLAVALIEESVKMVVPAWLFVRRRFRGSADGVLFGVAAGMGFAVLETMGYGLVALIHSGGRIGDAEQTLLFRGVMSPGGHAAWTGLVAAALWRTAERSGRRRAGLALIGAFAAAVLLHATWDTTDSSAVRLLLAIVGTTLLAAQIRRFPRADGGGQRLDHANGVTAHRPAPASDRSPR
jgi:RsiW-degrading membrane proteinase PrsW (M82 family)